MYDGDIRKDEDMKKLLIEKAIGAVQATRLLGDELIVRPHDVRKDDAAIWVGEKAEGNGKGSGSA